MAAREVRPLRSAASGLSDRRHIQNCDRQITGISKVLERRSRIEVPVRFRGVGLSPEPRLLNDHRTGSRPIQMRSIASPVNSCR
jgi:hypothetical protein